MNNIPEVKLGIVAVSRDCFPIELSQRRRKAVVDAFRNAGGEIVEIMTTVETKPTRSRRWTSSRPTASTRWSCTWATSAPRPPETLVAQNFDGPVMFAAAAEESGNDLIDGRGDAYCGMLNASYKPQDTRCEGVHTRVPGGHRLRGRGYDSRVHADSAHHTWASRVSR